MTPPPGRTRPMDEADVPAVLALERRVYTYPWSEANLRDCLRAGYGCFVHEAEAEIAAYIVVSCGGGEAQILNLVIAPAHQRRGIGGHLLDVAVERAEVCGADTLLLEVRPSNTGALALYARHGFHELGRRPDYYPAARGREDAVIMARAIAGRP